MERATARRVGWGTVAWLVAGGVGLGACHAVSDGDGPGAAGDGGGALEDGDGGADADTPRCGHDPEPRLLVEVVVESAMTLDGRPIVLAWTAEGALDEAPAPSVLRRSFATHEELAAFDGDYTVFVDGVARARGRARLARCEPAVRHFGLDLARVRTVSLAYVFARGAPDGVLEEGADGGVESSPEGGTPDGWEPRVTCAVLDAPRAQLGVVPGDFVVQLSLTSPVALRDCQLGSVAADVLAGASHSDRPARVELAFRWRVGDAPPRLGLLTCGDGETLVEGALSPSWCAQPASQRGIPAQLERRSAVLSAGRFVDEPYTGFACVFRDCVGLFTTP